VYLAASAIEYTPSPRAGLTGGCGTRAIDVPVAIVIYSTPPMAAILTILSVQTSKTEATKGKRAAYAAPLVAK
jgi:hypothetical protein